jgi:hypothetical protein
VNARQAQTLAKGAGILILISLFAGGFAEVYVPGKLLAVSDPVATARNVAEYAQLFRSSFALYLAEAVCDIALVLVFYLLLRPVSYTLSLLAAFFGLVSTCTFAMSELFYFVSALPVLDANMQQHLAPEQRNFFIYAALMLYGYGGSIFMVFYGIATTLRGYLIYRSAYLPAWLGILLMIAGIGFIMKNLLLVLSPEHASDFLLTPMFAAMIGLTAWLLIRGIDAGKWPDSIVTSEAILKSAP